MTQVISLNIGRARRLDTGDGAAVWSAIDKQPAGRRLRLTAAGFEGDERVDRRPHGAENHAVYAYPAAHYDFWQRYLGRGPFTYGHIGENLTLSGPLETQVRLGDVLRIGGATLRVVQPRIPCRKLSLRMGGSFSGTFLRSRKVGYYLRVLEPGDVGEGDAVELVESDANAPTLDDFVRITQLDYAEQPELERLLAARSLLPTWRAIIEDKLVRARSASPSFGCLELVVAEAHTEGPRYGRYRLVSARGQRLPPFRAGEALPIVGLDASGTRRGVWPCLLGGDPTERDAYWFTLRKAIAHAPPPAGRWAGALPFLLAPGSRLHATAPRGDFTLDALSPEASELVIWSEGIALAPVSSLLHDAAAMSQWRRVRVMHFDAAGSLELRREAEALLPRFASLELCFEAARPSAAWGLPASDAEVMLVGSVEFVEQARALLGPRARLRTACVDAI